ncbi:hotdog fold thioesterase [Sphingomonas sp. SM33]|uniref:Hotdog fold thioesterase n=1 Tax=Sphingomonas telluris TaxID=2907998 RepID=A0ABS9VLS8_9SPHN|nr:hotdog fold domain-containing protein [Sphingomonas telluris]MCH8615911.1 hotdog fold thioesterase [Sphingomonas telluris]
MSTVRIERRFRGPPESGNGGYVAGLVAAALGSSNCTVTLKAPPPIDEDLTLTTDDVTATLAQDDSVLVTASSEAVDIDVPPAPTLADAQDAEPRFTGHHRHIFPGCFVCGPERGDGDGMRIFPGPLHDKANRVAATWTPDETVSDGQGRVRPEFLWAALDCPGYFAAEDKAGMALLGRMSAVLHRPVQVGEPLIVTGWPIETHGRKHRVGSALHDANGEVVAAATATWITLNGERAA